MSLTKEQWEKKRQEIEKLLWKLYNPLYTPNMEEASEKVMAILTQALEEQRECLRGKVERLRIEVLPKHAEENGYECALDDILSLLSPTNEV